VNSIWNASKAVLSRKRELDTAEEYAIPGEEVTKAKSALTLALLSRLRDAARDGGSRIVLLDIPPTGRKGLFSFGF